MKVRYRQAHGETPPCKRVSDLTGCDDIKVGGSAATIALGLALMVLSAGAPAPVSAATSCGRGADALGVHRIVQIDASSGPIFGALNSYAHEPRFLQDNEVVLTFDDGPSPRITHSILKTLARFCTKATFFPTGRMAMAYPDTMRAVVDSGHTVGAHTWSHPNNLRRMKNAAAIAQVEKGFAGVARALGRPVAPFFRFPGLNHDKGVLTHLQNRGIATFSVDVVSDDSYVSDARQLVRQTLARVVRHKGGILLFHDIKRATAKALPDILKGLKARGFRIVHLTTMHPFKPNAAYAAMMTQRLKSTSTTPIAISAKPLHSILRQSVPTVGAFAVARPPITVLAPAKRPVELADVQKKRMRSLRGAITRDGWDASVDRRQRAGTDGLGTWAD